jgi:hypothetical protein
VDPPLPAGGCLTIGYGSSGAAAQTYFLREEQNVDVGFLKLFLTTKATDYTSVEQFTPFEKGRGSAPAPKQPLLWDTVLIAVVQNRAT